MFEKTTTGRPIPEPLGMHPNWVTGPGRAITAIHPDGQEYFVRWCCRNKCGGVYSETLNRWTLTTPIAFEDFLELLETDGIIDAESLDSWEMRRWIKACKLAAGAIA